MSGRGGGGGRGGKRNGVMFAKPDEPAFIRRMKEQLGYKEGPSIDTKREAMPELEPEDEKDKDDEQPTIVVLKPGDLSAEQVEILGGLKDPDEDEGVVDGKVIFKKPVKRVAAQGSAAAETEAKAQKMSESKQVKNKSLLSFDEEEDDD